MLAIAAIVGYPSGWVKSQIQYRGTRSPISKWHGPEMAAKWNNKNCNYKWLWPGLEVIKLELIIRLKIKRVRKQPIIALHFESETVLKFYNIPQSHTADLMKRHRAKTATRHKIANTKNKYSKCILVDWFEINWTSTREIISSGYLTY